MTPELQKMIDEAKVKTERLMFVTEIENSTKMLDEEIHVIEMRLADLRRLKDSLWKLRQFMKAS